MTHCAAFHLPEVSHDMYGTQFVVVRILDFKSEKQFYDKTF